jgi:iron complex transport system ATP-binding protein
VGVEIDNLRFSYGEHSVLHEICFKAEPGDMVAVLGPNGVGKSTLFRCMLGLLRPSSGTILLGGRDIRKLNRAEIAREIAYIPQSVSPAFNYSVLDLVLMGLTNRLGALESPKAAHIEKAEAVLESLGIAHLRHRGCAQISGGELQLALLARALLQSARNLIMDEPTASLDFANQHKVMEHVSALAAKGYTVILSTHDPNLAALHANRVLAIKDGRVLSDGEPQDVLSEPSLSALYGIGVVIRSVDYGGRSIGISLPRERLS